MLYPELLFVPGMLLPAFLPIAAFAADGTERRTLKVDVLDFGLGFIHAVAADASEPSAVATIPAA